MGMFVCLHSWDTCCRFLHSNSERRQESKDGEKGVDGEEKVALLVKQKKIKTKQRAEKGERLTLRYRLAVFSKILNSRNPQCCIGLSKIQPSRGIPWPTMALSSNITMFELISPMTVVFHNRSKFVPFLPFSALSPFRNAKTSQFSHESTSINKSWILTFPDSSGKMI